DDRAFDGLTVANTTHTDRRTRVLLQPPLQRFGEHITRENAFEERQSSPRRRWLFGPPLKGGNIVVSRRQGRPQHRTETLHLDRADRDGK
ncbi:hypothetical protein A2U01_0056813, partial [Trifolium medium]|nr:hypothetical protein [Trifolium medium]